MRHFDSNWPKVLDFTAGYGLCPHDDCSLTLIIFARLGNLPKSAQMALNFALETDSSPRGTDTWWAMRRLRYNIGLLVAGPLGFGLYALAISRCIELRAPGDWEITILTTLFQGFAYLVMIGVANLCYYLGPWSERVVHPTNIASYRRITFRLGFWFSVLLPFVPSAVLLVICPLHAGKDKRTILESTRTTLIVAALFFAKS
jgi:hypothetical protein